MKKFLAILLLIPSLAWADVAIYFRMKDKSAVKSVLSGPIADVESKDGKLKTVTLGTDAIDQPICVVADDGSGNSIWSAVVPDAYADVKKVSVDFLGIGMDGLKVISLKDYEKIVQKVIDTGLKDADGKVILKTVPKEYKIKGAEKDVAGTDIPLHTYFGYDVWTGRLK